MSIRIGECCSCSKWHVLCKGVQADPDGTWNGKNGGCTGFRLESLPKNPTCFDCTVDICGRECQERRHGGSFETMSHEACYLWKDEPKATEIYIQPQRTLEAFL